jgi:hypothetical protein
LAIELLFLLFFRSKLGEILPIKKNSLGWLAYYSITTSNPMFFFLGVCQFCDVAKVTIIHDWNILISQIWLQAKNVIVILFFKNCQLQ